MANQSQSAGSFASQLASRLRGPDAQAAWDDFLNRYAEAILLIAKRHNHNRDDCNDCFVFICEKLSERQHERLLKFQPGGRASFRSWLNVVVANLCIDWHRARHGRIRPFQCVQSLSPLDQAVFKYRFVQRRSLGACLELLRPRFPEIDSPVLALSLQRLNNALSPRHHWQLATQHRQFVSYEEQQGLPSPAWKTDERSQEPDQHAVRSERRRLLAQALNALEPRKRLVLKLRYQQELSLKEICRLMRMEHPAQAHRLIQSALSDLQHTVVR